MNIPRQIFAQSLIKAVQASFRDQPEPDIIDSINYCDPRFGQFSSNIAFRLAKQYNKSPEDIANIIITELSKEDLFASVEFLHPGFINIQIKNQVWRDYFISLKSDFLKSSKCQGQRVQLEFVSANPTGPLVLTNAWQGYYGDILANILSSQGFSVEREYYLNDGGNQITALGRAIQQALGVEFDKEIAQNLYRGDYIDKCAEIITTEFGSPDLVKKGDPAKIGQRTSEIIIENYIKPDLDRLGVRFDSMYSESTPDIPIVLKKLEAVGLIYQKDGATWLDGKKVGLNQDEVLVRSYDHGYTYFLKDIAYQLERLEERGFDRTITIVGPDHHGQVIRLVKTLEALGYTGLDEISTQTIRLIKDGKEFKMSKRKGNYILLSEFLDTVPTEVARFYFAMRDTNTHMDFDIDLVREHSAKNPVYYSLYAYARACSIQHKATEAGVGAQDDIGDYQLSKTELRLAIEMSKIPVILEDIVDTRKVHQLLHQVVEIARVFHELYEDERIVGHPDAEAKLLVIQCFKRAYEGIFGILGVSLLEKM